MASEGDPDNAYGSHTELNTMDHSTSSMKCDITNTINKGTEAYQNHQDEQQQPERLLFFNYHEYIINNYTKIGSKTNDIHEQALVITHFPNYTAPEGAELDKQTRIVRIPRVFGVKGIVYPEFSTRLPGTEDAAILESLDDVGSVGFEPRGIYEGHVFGATSHSPLSIYFDDIEFKEIMTEINNEARNCYSSYHLWNMLEFLLDMLTFWLLSDILKFQSKRLLDDFERFISRKNKELEPRHVKIISPRRTAYLSIDFQIPRPSI